MKNRNGGFVLVTFVAVFMALFTVLWLMHARGLQHQQQAFEEQFQAQLHQTRVELFWLAMQKPNSQSWLTWQTSPTVRNWVEQLALNGLAVQVEINPVRLAINLHSAAKATDLSTRMVHSTAHGTVLQLSVPDLQEYQERTPWLYREHLAMETNLTGGGHALLNVGQLSGDHMQLETLHGDYLTSATLNTQTLVTQQIHNAPYADLNVLSANNLVSEQMQVVQGVINYAQTNKTTATIANSTSGTLEVTSAQTLQASDIASANMQVHQAVQLQGGAQQRLNEMYHQLVGLEQSIYHCIQETLWCLAPVQPELALYHCLNCRAEQVSEYFQASISLSVSHCRHGCGIEAYAAPGIHVSCSPNFIAAGESGLLRCIVETTVTNATELAFDVEARVYSGKDANVFTSLKVPIYWQLAFRDCSPESYRVTVEDSLPTMTYLLSLPTTPGNERYIGQQTVYQECHVSNHQTFMRCELFASCSKTGVWGNIQGKCVCRGW